MTICPIALAVGCEKCPAFKFCPLTTVLGDQQEDKVDASPMTLAHDRDLSEAISQKEIPYTSDDPDFLSTNRSTVPKKKLTKDERLALMGNTEKKLKEAIETYQGKRRKEDD